MSNRKNYNSIVFLTTLSVYLGLVLVGTPPILAQAALTQKIEIQNEAEIKDDLDKKPEDKPCSETEFHTTGRDDRFIEQYAAIILKSLKTSYASKDYELAINASGGLDDEIFDNLFPTTKKDLIGDFNYSLDKNNFVANFGFTSKTGIENISWIASSFNASLNFLRNESQSKPQKTILKNTQISFENNQVFIVTRLPRASIDEFLAKKDAQ
jgi:hypothetical protein